MEDLGERLKKVAKRHGGQMGLALSLGVEKPRTFIAYFKKGRGDNFWPYLEKVLALDPAISPMWLYRGEGEMLGANEGLTALKAENEELKAELEAERRLNRQLTAKLLVDGAGDQDAATATGKASGGQG